MRAALSLALWAMFLPAYAQVNKCTDANGRISYQANPCPGSSSARTVSPSGAGAQPVPPAKPAPPPLPNQAAKDCAERSDSLVKSLETGRSITSKISPSGGRDEATKMLVDRPKGEFLRSCSRFGFASPDSPAAIDKNRALSTRLLQEYQVAYDKRLAFETEQRAAAPPPPSYVGRSATGQSASSDASRSAKVGWPSEEEMNMQSCADDWESEMIGRSSLRGRLPERLAAERDQRGMARFMPKCGKYGFEWPKDEAGEKRNEKVLEALKAKIQAVRTARDQATMQRDMERQATDRARERREEAERERVAKAQTCDYQAKSIAEARASLDKVHPNQREAYRRDLDAAEQDWRKNCQ